MSEWKFVIAAYALTWLVLLGYALRLAHRLRQAADDLATLAPRNATEREP